MTPDLHREAEILREQIAWHEAREANPPAPYHPVAWALCIVGLRSRLRELDQHLARP